MSSTEEPVEEGVEETVEEVEEVEEVYESNCLPTDQRCKEKEAAAREAAAAEAAAAMEGVFQADEEKAYVSDMGLVCTMDGFTDMIKELTEILFSAAGIAKELVIGMIPENFKKALEFGWEGAVGMGNWVGYVLAAIYYAAEDFGFGVDICEAFGYGYWLIDQMHIIVDFMPKGEDSSGGVDISKLASQEAKDDAAGNALQEALAAKKARDEAQKAEIAAEIAAGVEPTAEGVDAAIEGDEEGEAEEGEAEEGEAEEAEEAEEEEEEEAEEAAEE